MRFFDFDKSVKDIEYYEMLENLMERWEHEVVEFKEAKGGVKWMTCVHLFCSSAAATRGRFLSWHSICFLQKKMKKVQQWDSIEERDSSKYIYEQYFLLSTLLYLCYDNIIKLWYNGINISGN